MTNIPAMQYTKAVSIFSSLLLVKRSFFPVGNKKGTETDSDYRVNTTGNVGF